jgi:hypothetical protein
VESKFEAVENKRMIEYVVGKIDDIAPGTAIAVQAGRRTIAVFRLGNEFFAVPRLHSRANAGKAARRQCAQIVRAALTPQPRRPGTTIGRNKVQSWRRLYGK